MNRRFFLIIRSAIIFAIVVAAITQGWATDETFPIDKDLIYKNQDTLRQIQKAVIPAVYDDDNIIALHIFRQTIHALGQEIILGNIPETSRTVLRNKQEERWLQNVKKMADDGDPFFQMVVAILHYNGCGVALDQNRAIEIWRQLSGKGFGPASFAMGKFLEFAAPGSSTDTQRIRKADEYYRKAGEWGVPGGWYNLGCLYADGKLGKKQVGIAMGYWEKAAVMGHAPAQYNLGFNYTDSAPGVPRNRELGRKWLEAAARQGDHRAIYNVSKHYNILLYGRYEPKILPY